MPKASKQSVTEVEDFGVAVDRIGHLDGYTVNFVAIRETHDLAPMLATLPQRQLLVPALGVRRQGTDHRALRRPRGDRGGR